MYLEGGGGVAHLAMSLFYPTHWQFKRFFVVVETKHLSLLRQYHILVYVSSVTGSCVLFIHIYQALTIRLKLWFDDYSCWLPTYLLTTYSPSASGQYTYLQRARMELCNAVPYFIYINRIISLQISFLWIWKLFSRDCCISKYYNIKKTTTYERQNKVFFYYFLYKIVFFSIQLTPNL